MAEENQISFMKALEWMKQHPEETIRSGGGALFMYSKEYGNRFTYFNGDKPDFNDEDINGLWKKENEEK